MRGDAFTKFLRAQIHIAQDEIAAARVRDVAASVDGSGSKHRHTVLRKRGALHAYRLALKTYLAFRGWK